MLQREKYARPSFNVHPIAALGTCSTPDEKKCIDDKVVVCLPDATNRYMQWVPEMRDGQLVRANKAEECRHGLIESLVITKPWINRLLR